MLAAHKQFISKQLSHLFTVIIGFSFVFFSINGFAQRGGAGDPGGGGHTVSGQNGRQLFDRVDRLSKVRINLLTDLPEYTNGAAALIQKVHRFMPVFGFELQEATFKKSWFFSRTPFACRLDTFVVVENQQTAACQNNLEVRIFQPEWENLNRETRVELIIHEIVRAWSPSGFPEASLRKVVEAIVFSETEVDFAIEIEEVPELKNRSGFLISSRMITPGKRQNILIAYYDYLKSFGQFYCSQSSPLLSIFENWGTENFTKRFARSFFTRDPNVITPDYSSREWPHFRVDDRLILHVEGNKTSNGFPTYLRHVFAISTAIRPNSTTESTLTYEDLFALSRHAQVMDPSNSEISWLRTFLPNESKFDEYYEAALDRCKQAGYSELFMHASGIFICHKQGSTRDISLNFLKYRTLMTNREIFAEGESTPPSQALILRMTERLNEELLGRLIGRVNRVPTTLVERCAELDENINFMKQSDNFTHALQRIKEKR